ncbi:colicin immunity domain-containing protein [Alteromonas sp. A079]|uniref:colicin immunity domain-containing protein n=1 Tax=Alteromonas sp. A079 TaxID=3410268 RepID=UPI003BA149CD
MLAPQSLALAVQGSRQTVEDEFKVLVESFIENKVSADQFMTSFMNLWRETRDSGVLNECDPRLGRILDRMFTSCDAYDPAPEGPFEISAVQFKEEIKDMAYLCWGN